MDDGVSFVLQTTTSTESVRVGLLKAWGAAITEVSLNGIDFVNHDDPGRQIQTSLWDGNANYSTSWGYNPIESGDHFFQGSPVLASTLMPDSIYTKTQPIEWAPENFGGGPGNPVLGDAYIEKWIRVVPGYNRVFKVHYKITHFGTDLHADTFQELPVMYVNPNVPNFVYYGGSAPWTNGVLSQHMMSYSCCDMLATPEQWGAYVDDANIGIALYTPQQFPNSKGFNAFSTLQFTPMCPFTWEPGSMLEFDTFILVGPVSDSRTAIYVLHRQQTSVSTLPPMGGPDAPANGDVVSGTVLVDGWSWALPGMASVEVFVDGNHVGTPNYGIISLHKDLAFSSYSTFAGKLDWKFTRKNHLYLVGAPLNQSRQTVLQRTIMFHGQTFNVGVVTRANLSAPLIAPGYQYDIFRRRRWHLGLAVQFNLYNSEASLFAAAQVNTNNQVISAKKSLLAPIPVAGPQARFYLTNSPRVYVEGNLYGMYLFGYGNFVSTSDNVGVTLTKHLSVNAGYQLGSRLNVNVDSKKDRLGLSLTQKGPIVGVEVSF